MPSLVVGIFPGTDPAAIEKALAGQQIDLSKVKVVARTTPTPETDESPIDFLTVAESMESNSLSDDLTKGLGIMGDAGGTGVPGLGSGGPSLGSFSSRAATTSRLLAGLSIPGDEIDNFNGAVADGRAVVAYPDPGADATAVAASFRAAGLRNVRVY